MVRVDYSRAIELKVANGNEDLVNWWFKRYKEQYGSKKW
jgi:hypothetical protein